MADLHLTENPGIVEQATARLAIECVRAVGVSSSPAGSLGDLTEGSVSGPFNHLKHQM